MAGTSQRDQSPTRSQRFLRPSLRNATFVVPRTGEHVKRAVTLRSPSRANGDGPSDSNGTPRSSRSGLRRPSSWFDARQTTSRVWSFVKSSTGQNVFKCSVAYLLASMATFVPAIAGLLGHQDGKHIVATVTVYFHPARTQGSMIEATFLALAATAYAMAISFGSMATSLGFATGDLIWLGYTVVLVVFVGAGLGLVGWLKLKLGSPLVNVACSLTSLAIITVLTKEGAVQLGRFSYEKVLQVLKMVLMGVGISTIVCLLLKPVSARQELKTSMIEVTDAFGEMLAAITRSFLYGYDTEMDHSSLKSVEARHKSVFSTLINNLREAKFEHYACGTERQYHLECKIVDCLQRLAQNIGGLRSAASTQFAILESSTNGQTTPNGRSWDTDELESPSTLFSPTLTSDHYKVLSSIDELPENENEGNATEHSRESSGEQGSASTLSSSADIFARFISQLGPSMKSLAYTLGQILEELPFSPAPSFEVTINSNFRTSLEDAISLYTRSRREALSSIYKAKDLNRTRPVAQAADFEEAAASCGHFSFSLLDFADEMKVYLDILDDYKLEMEAETRRRTWHWVEFWRRFKWIRNDEDADPERRNLLGSPKRVHIPHGIPNPPERQNSMIALGLQSTKGFRAQIWKVFAFIRRDDIKFAIKVGIGALLYALPSFIPYTRPVYSHWRGEWGLLSYMLVCSMTIGASNTTGYQRFLGTCFGAICAVLSWLASNGNAIALAGLGWLFSLGCFYIIVAMHKGPMGRFILLTYNLSALYAYSLSVKDDDDDDDEGGRNPKIFAIALHRVVAVMSGCLWGLFITRVIWPISARRKFVDGLSLLWLRMGLVWKRDPLSALTSPEPNNAYLSPSEELSLTTHLSALSALLPAATHEFELRGPFPISTYSHLVRRTSNMLDAFHAMNTIIAKDPRASNGEAAILEQTHRERHQLSQRIGHQFQVMAGSISLEFTLSDSLPNVEHARDRLLAGIFTFRRDDGGRVDDEDFALIYAYALVTAQLELDLAAVSEEVEKLFGKVDEETLKLQ